MKQIVFASCNQKKAEEMQRMAPDNIKIVCLKDIPEAANLPQAEETGKTFLENATIIAKYIVTIVNTTIAQICTINNVTSLKASLCDTLRIC